MEAVGIIVLDTLSLNANSYQREFIIAGVNGGTKPAPLPPPQSDPRQVMIHDPETEVNYSIVTMVSSWPIHTFPAPVPPAMSEFKIGTFVLRNLVHRIPSYPSVYLNKAGQRYNKGTMVLGVTAEQVSIVR